MPQGIREGWGQQTEPDGSIYKGDFANDKYHGVGTLKSGPAEYHGYWKCGQPHGEGRELREDGAVFEGSWLRGAINGRGVLSLPNGQSQTGEFQEGEMWRGVLADASGGLLGGWRAGKFYAGKPGKPELAATGPAPSRLDNFAKELSGITVTESPLEPAPAPAPEPVPEPSAVPVQEPAAPEEAPEEAPEPGADPVPEPAAAEEVPEVSEPAADALNVTGD